MGLVCRSGNQSGSRLQYGLSSVVVENAGKTVVRFCAPSDSGLSVIKRGTPSLRDSSSVGMEWGCRLQDEDSFSTRDGDGEVLARKVHESRWYPKQLLIARCC